ncbi:MAG TPA: hypothetical protein VKC61_25020 [Pyrinomonadaceae bacterium]|nr:hypothetical protein [Pyrinomonadaceae bacterium]
MPIAHKVRPYRVRSLQLLVIAVAFIFTTPTPSYHARAQTNAGKVPLTHETMWMMKRVGAPVPSPDGKWVVFSLVEPAYDEKDQVSDFGLCLPMRVPSHGD